MLQLWYYMILLMLSFFTLVNRALALRLQEVVLLLVHNGWLLAESCFANWEDLEWCISAASDFFSLTWLVSACTNLCHVFVTMQVWLPDEIWLSDSSETERIYVWPFVLHLSEPNTAMFGKLMIRVSLLNSGYLQVVVLFLDWSGNCCMVLQLVQTDDMGFRIMMHFCLIGHFLASVFCSTECLQALLIQ